jgi:hypothetical protein
MYIKINCILFAILQFWANELSAQELYKTPYGKKYHSSNCRTVRNVSTKLVERSEILQYGLTACKICRPPIVNIHNNLHLTKNNKAAGINNQTVQCRGFTKKNKRCTHRTRIKNGFCFQHRP